MSFLNCSRSREKVSSPIDNSPPYDKEQCFRRPESNVKKDVSSPGSSQGEFPNIMLEYGSEPPQYDIYTTIGKGCNDAATISVAQHKASGHNVAIRQIDLDQADTDYGILQREIVLCRQLHHENIMPFYTSFVHNNEIWTVMPLMAYGSCRDLMHAYFTSGLPEQAIAYIMRDVSSALEYLHSRGVVHRGVKASHILISAAGRVCLSGLRNSSHMVQNGEWRKCVFDFPVHPQKMLCWLSPEILEQNLSGYDTKSDVYSLGITACELANGYAPFTDMAPTQMLLEKLNGTKPVLADSTTIADLTADENVTNSDIPEDSGIDSVTNTIQKNSALGYAYNRTFSSHFHQFVELCLEREVNRRPSTSVMLNHPFLRGLRKKTTSALPALLHPVTPLLDVSKLPKGLRKKTTSALPALLHPVTPLLDVSNSPKGQRKRTTSALPALLHPVTPILDVSKLPKDDSAVEDLAEEMEDLHFDEDWEF